MTFHTDKEDPEFKYTRMSCREFVLLPLYSNVIYAIIGGQMINIHHYLSICLEYLDHWRKPDIDPINKDRGGSFHSAAHLIFRETFLRNFNEVLFKRGNKALKYHVFGGNNFHRYEKQGIFMLAYVL